MNYDILTLSFASVGFHAPVVNKKELLSFLLLKQMSEDSLEQDRPKIESQSWINLDDFRRSRDIESVRSIYRTREEANLLLSETYVALEKTEEVNGWSHRKKKQVTAWQNNLEYLYTVNWFFLYELKAMEGFWSWIIIVISTVTSTLSLIDLEFFGWTDVPIRGATSAFSVATTLIAAWIKKENYVERIKDIDRYIQGISKLNYEIDAVITKAPWDRVPYTKFTELYEGEVTRMLAAPPPMSPEELKTAVWKLTKFYPELVKDTYPWYKKDELGEYIVTTWGQDILRTYEAVYYNSYSRKLLGCYYCKCKCCRRKPNIAEVYKPRERCQRRELSLWPIHGETTNINTDINHIELGCISEKLSILTRSNHVEEEEEPDIDESSSQTIIKEIDPTNSFKN